jgi:hypothetical protein
MYQKYKVEEHGSHMLRVSEDSVTWTMKTMSGALGRDDYGYHEHRKLTEQQDEQRKLTEHTNLIHSPTAKPFAG